MRGHIAKKGNRYYAVVNIGTDPATGKRRLKWHGSWLTREEADRELTAIVARVHQGTYVATSRSTVASFLRDEWLPASRATLKPSTAQLYRTIVNAYVIPRLGAVKLQELGPAQLNTFYAELLEAGRTSSDGALSPTSVRNVHRVLHRALRDAVKWGVLTRNPAAVADPPRAETPEMRTWTAQQLGGFLDRAVGTTFYPLWLLIGTTGLRRAEALGTRWSDLDLDAGRLAVTQTLAYVGTRAQFSEPKTRRSRRSVPLPAETVQALRAHRAAQLEGRLALGADYRDDLDLVFADALGEPVRPATVSRTFSRLVTEAKLPRIGLHGLRHSWASLALGVGVPSKVASEILGHASTAITLDTYSHVTPSMAEDATQRVAGLIPRATR